jgi:MoxR-like ATPase
MVELGISPRGALAVSRMARACAYLKGRDYVVPEDVRAVFVDVCAHRLLLSQKAKAAHLTTQAVLEQILADTKEPYHE